MDTLSLDDLDQFISGSSYTPAPLAATAGADGSDFAADLDAFIPANKLEFGKDVPLEAHRDLKGLVDSSAFDFWEKNPAGTFQDYEKDLSSKLGPNAGWLKVDGVNQRARAAYLETGNAYKKAVSERGQENMPSSFEQGLDVYSKIADEKKHKPNRDIARAKSDVQIGTDSQNYLPKGHDAELEKFDRRELRVNPETGLQYEHVTPRRQITKGPRGSVEVEQNAKNIVEFNEKFVPKFFLDRYTKSETERKNILEKYYNHDPEAREMVKRFVNGVLDSDAGQAKTFDQAMSKHYGVWWDNAGGRAVLTGAANFSSKLAGLVGAGSKDQANLRGELGRGVNQAQDRTGLGGFGRWAENTGAGITDSLLSAGTGAMAGAGIAGTMFGATTGGAISAGATTFEDAYGQGLQRGFSGGKNLVQSGFKAGMEVGFEMIGNKLFGPGLEAAFAPKLAAKTTSAVEKGLFKALGSGSKETVKRILEEMPSEVMTTIGQATVDQVSGMDPQSLDPDKLAADLGNTIAQTILAVGVSQTGRGTFDLWKNHKERSQSRQTEFNRAFAEDIPKVQASETPIDPKTVSEDAPVVAPAPSDDTTVVTPTQAIAGPLAASGVPMGIPDTSSEPQGDSSPVIPVEDEAPVPELGQAAVAGELPAQGDSTAETVSPTEIEKLKEKIQFFRNHVQLGKQKLKDPSTPKEDIARIERTKNHDEGVVAKLLSQLEGMTGTKPEPTLLPETQAESRPEPLPVVELKTLAPKTPVRFLDKQTGAELIGERNSFGGVSVAGGKSMRADQVTEVRVITPESMGIEVGATVDYPGMESDGPYEVTKINENGTLDLRGKSGAMRDLPKVSLMRVHAAAKPAATMQTPSEKVTSERPANAPPAKPRRIGFKASAETSKTAVVDDADKSVRAKGAEKQVSEVEKVHANRRDDGPAPPWFSEALADPELLDYLEANARKMTRGTSVDPEDLKHTTIIDVTRKWKSFDQTRGDLKKLAWNQMRTTFDSMGTAAKAKKAGGDKKIVSTDADPSGDGKTIGGKIPDAGRSVEQNSTYEEMLGIVPELLGQLPKDERQALEGWMNDKKVDPRNAESLEASIKKHGPALERALTKLRSNMAGMYDSEDIEYFMNTTGPKVAPGMPTQSGLRSQPDPSTPHAFVAMSPPVLKKMMDSLNIDLFLDKATEHLGYTRNTKGIGPRIPGNTKLDDLRIALGLKAMSNEDLVAYVLSHELGHAYDWKGIADVNKLKDRGNLLGHIFGFSKFVQSHFNNPATSNTHDAVAIRDELLEWSKWWRGQFTGTPQHVAYRLSDNELFADATSGLFSAPGDLQTRAPLFWQALMEGMDQHPEARSAYDHAQALMMGLTAPQSDKYVDLSKELFEKAEDAHKEAYKLRSMASGTWWDKTKQFAAEVYFKAFTSFFDRHTRSLSKAVRADNMAAVRAIEDMNTTDSPINADMVFVENEIKPLREMGMDLDTFGSFLMGERNLYGDRKEMANPGAFGEKTSATMLSHIRRRHGVAGYNAARKAADAIRGRFMETMREAHKSGLITDDMMQEIENNKYYVPYVVHQYAHLMHVPAAIQSQIGTFKDIQNPLISLVMKNGSVWRAIDINNGKRTVIDLERDFNTKNGLPQVRTWTRGDAAIPKVPTAGMAYVQYQEKGVWYQAEVASEIADQVNRPMSGSEWKVTNSLNSFVYGTLHPLYVTANPGFYPANLMRDLQRTLLHIKTQLESDGKKFNKAKFMKTWIQSTRHAWDFANYRFTPDVVEGIESRTLSTQNRLFSKYDPELADHGTYDRMMLQAGVNPAPLSQNAAASTLQRIGRFGGALAVASEQTSKIAAYQFLVSEGYSKKEAADFAINYAGTPNTRKGGTLRSLLNFMVTYGNVGVQSRATGILPSPRSMAWNSKTARHYWVNQIKFGFALKGIEMALRYGIPVIGGTAGIALARALAKGLGYEEDDADKFLKEMRGYYDKIPSFYLSSFALNIPLYGSKSPDDDNNEQVDWFSLPLDESLKPGIVAAHYLLESMFGDDSRYVDGEEMREKFYTDLAGILMPSSGQTYLNIASNWKDYMQGKNPVDDFRGREIIPEMKHAAGYGGEEMVAWTLSQFGIASQIVNVFASQVLNQPFEGNAASAQPAWKRAAGALNPLRQFLRTTRGALTQEQLTDERRAKQEKAQFRDSLGEADATLSKMRSSYKRQTDAGVQNPRAIINDALLGEWEKRRNAMKKEIEKYEGLAKNAEGESKAKLLAKAKEWRDTLTTHNEEMLVDIHNSDPAALNRGGRLDKIGSELLKSSEINPKYKGKDKDEYERERMDRRAKLNRLLHARASTS
jgi:hypothetical protein